MPEEDLDMEELLALEAEALEEQRLMDELDEWDDISDYAERFPDDEDSEYDEW